MGEVGLARRDGAAVAWKNQPNGNGSSAAGGVGPEVNGTGDELRVVAERSPGVITSSSPERVKLAPRPSTLTTPTESPAKSRSKRESACVARASIVTGR